MTSAVPLSRSERSPAQAVRSITILGATGSIGSSTIDLIKRNRGRFRVEAVTAARNAAALGKLARELDAALRRRRRPGRLRRAQVGAGRLRHRGRRGRGRRGRGGAAAGRLGDGRDHRRGGLAADARGGRARRDRRARQQGDAGLRRQPVHAPRGGARRHRAAGRFRAQRDLPGARRRHARERAPHHPHRVGRAVPHLDGGGRSAPPRPSRRCATPTGRWARRSRSIPPR